MLDAHAHLYHPSWYPSAFSDQLASSLESDPRKSSQVARVLLRMLSDPSGEATIRTMDQAGIEHRIVLVLDWGLELGEAELPIRDVHAAILGICRRFPDRLTGFAGLDPRRPEAEHLLAWAVDSLGARGLKLHPTSTGWTLADDRTLTLVEVAAQRGLVVLVHIGATFPALTDRHAGPAAFLALARRFPDTTFIAGHAGFDRWREFEAEGELMPNVLLDVSGWQSRDDAGETFAQELLAITRRFPGQVVFGTDSPFFGLPASGADARWTDRVREILGRADAPPSDSFFAHPVIASLAP